MNTFNNCTDSQNKWGQFSKTHLNDALLRALVEHRYPQHLVCVPNHSLVHSFAYYFKHSVFYCSDFGHIIDRCSVIHITSNMEHFEI